MNTPVAINADVRRARSAFAVVGLIVPLVVAAIAVGALLTWLPGLPDQIVTHWGSNGPDGYGSPMLLVWMQIILGLALPLMMTVPILLMMKQSWGVTCRLLGATSLATSGMVAVSTVGSVAIQRDSAGGEIGVVMAIGFSAMVLLGLAGWFLQPNVTATPAPSKQALQLRLAPGEKAAWFGTAAMSRPGVITLALAVLILIVSTVWVFALGQGGAGWITLVVTVLMIALIATTLVFRVRINGDGLLMRSIAGWPRWNIPASNITEVQVVQVNPMAEFGGWGLRLAIDGRMGVVLRTGEGLQVTRANGRTFVVTIDDARTAAAALTAAMNNPDRGENS
ncbi:hypothetical protein DC31_08755 [Microbacterium sp. CH12i]|uniref:DUF1648 domain-containing protein n=1 Tax=Microbacterium sp. CH12i TaxID=1479651 RepID=UPI000460EB9B|nr:DUF1648 domain-containing protein [Microbacterium sp. CH12i]KDA06496.1 hypothetical protein DC31_08755 [Microbacterium sp. CH12i]